MSVSDIPDKVKLRLWVMAGGRCEYTGCNAPLWRDDLTFAQVNAAYIAHIVADSPDGPRGDPVLSPQLSRELSNLMLLCDVHHRLIDREQVAEHPVQRLQDMKRLHEQRIELLTSLQPEMRSEILMYGAEIGPTSPYLSVPRCVQAILPSRYPASQEGIALGLGNCAYRDHERQYWQFQADNLRRLVAETVRPRLASGQARHLSIFALAPQPLLALLGSLLTDIPAADVYQLHREPPDWVWQAHPPGFTFEVRRPDRIRPTPALVLSLSATIVPERVHAVLGTDCSLWSITVKTPNNDFLKSRLQLQQFREALRLLLDEMKAAHGEGASVHVFPAMPVSAAVEIGRVLMPKADLPLRIYDQNRQSGGFVHALDLNNVTSCGEAGKCQ